MLTNWNDFERDEQKGTEFKNLTDYFLNFFLIKMNSINYNLEPMNTWNLKSMKIITFQKD